MKFARPVTSCLLALSVLCVSCRQQDSAAGQPVSDQTRRSSVSTKTASDSGKVIQNTGIALTPRNFPNHTARDVADMLKAGKDVGDYAVFIYQWSQPDLLDVARKMMGMSKDAGYTPILAISPTVLSGLRGQWDVPAAVRDKAKGNLTFQDKAVHEPYIKTVLDLAELKPPYLCLATEINLLAINNVQQYITFAHVYKKLYPVIKKKSPNTKVFVSFQYDFMQLLDNKEPAKVKEHSKLIDIFRPELDLIALTSYPADHFQTPADIPNDYYEGIYKHVGRDEEIIYMEMGWPSTGKGDEAEQLKFIDTLPRLLAGVKPQVVAWSLLHDVKTPALGGDLAATGLITPDGKPKPAYQAFKKLKAN